MTSEERKLLRYTDVRRRDRGNKKERNKFRNAPFVTLNNHTGDRDIFKEGHRKRAGNKSSARGNSRFTRTDPIDRARMYFCMYYLRHAHVRIVLGRRPSTVHECVARESRLKFSGTTANPKRGLGRTTRSLTTCVGIYCLGLVERMHPFKFTLEKNVG